MNKNLKSLILAFICYSPTLVNAPLTYIYLFISLLGSICLLRDWKNNNVLKSDYFLLFFLLVSVVVYIAGEGVRENVVGKSKNDFIPYTAFIVTTIFFARSLNHQVFKILFYFILFEVFIGILEYTLGVPYFIKPLTTSQTEFRASYGYFMLQQSIWVKCSY